MHLFSNHLFYIGLYLVSAVLFTQHYKIVTKSMNMAAALTVLLETMAGIFCLLFLPFFSSKLPTKLSVYFFLGIAIIFYALQDRLSTIVRSGIEASTYNIIEQLTTVFMITAGVVFFKESFIINKTVGTLLILISNFLVFYHKGTFKLNRYLLLGIAANICFTMALLIDVNFSKQFNLSFYVALTLLIPAGLISKIHKIKLKHVLSEYKQGNRKAIIITAVAWGTMLLSQLGAYQQEKITVVAPLFSLTVILNVIVGYIFLKEKDHLVKKLIAGILIFISVLFIKM